MWTHLIDPRGRTRRRRGFKVLATSTTPLVTVPLLAPPPRERAAAALPTSTSIDRDSNVVYGLDNTAHDGTDMNSYTARVGQTLITG